MSEKAQRLHDLMCKWNAVEGKPDFTYDGLTCILVIDDGLMLAVWHGVTIKDCETIILKTRRVIYHYDILNPNPDPLSTWRTTVYDKSYSDKIDELMDALAKAIEFEETRF